MFFSDNQGQVLYHNESFRQRLRNQSASFIGQNIKEILNKSSAEQQDREKIDTITDGIHQGRVDIEITTKIR